MTRESGVQDRSVKSRAPRELMFCVVQDSLSNGSSTEKICTGSLSKGRSRFRPFDMHSLTLARSEPRNNPSIKRDVNAVYQVKT